MSTESLLSGADAYTTPAEVVTAPDNDVPEATPTIVSSAIGSFVLSFNTVKGGC
ncbi:LxmA leader domain family RiPP [Microbispora sp. CA-135349]|uniref:LxmA leader domain family RiPP n=1 Tax=Microbispora sp. CA-135349 TaxID=3239953 RepID=UPI003D94EA51